MTLYDAIENFWMWNILHDVTYEWRHQCCMYETECLTCSVIIIRLTDPHAYSRQAQSLLCICKNSEPSTVHLSLSCNNFLVQHVVDSEFSNWMVTFESKQTGTPDLFSNQILYFCIAIIFACRNFAPFSVNFWWVSENELIFVMCLWWQWRETLMTACRQHHWQMSHWWHLTSTHSRPAVAVMLQPHHPAHYHTLLASTTMTVIRDHLTQCLYVPPSCCQFHLMQCLCDHGCRWHLVNTAAQRQWHQSLASLQCCFHRQQVMSVMQDTLKTSHQHRSHVVLMQDTLKTSHQHRSHVVLIVAWTLLQQPYHRTLCLMRHGHHTSSTFWLHTTLWLPVALYGRAVLTQPACLQRASSMLHCHWMLYECVPPVHRRRVPTVAASVILKSTAASHPLTLCLAHVSNFQHTLHTCVSWLFLDWLWIMQTLMF